VILLLKDTRPQDGSESSKWAWAMTRG
jgi:hypothetical protein